MADKEPVISEITINIRDLNYSTLTVGHLLRTNDVATEKPADRAEQNLIEQEALIAANKKSAAGVNKNTRLADLADPDGNIRIPLFDEYGSRLFDAAKMGSIVKASGYAEGTDLKQAHAQRQEEQQGKRSLTTDIQTARLEKMTKQIGEAQLKRWEEEQRHTGGEGLDSVAGGAGRDAQAPVSSPAEPKNPEIELTAHEQETDLRKTDAPAQPPADVKKDAVPTETVNVDLNELDGIAKSFGQKNSTVKYVGGGPQGAKDGSKENLAVQGALAYLGYDLGDTGKDKNGVDGDAGKKTRDAIVKFQQDNGIEPVDGRAGEDTVAKIKEKVAAKQEQDKEKGKPSEDKEKTGTISITPKDDMQIADLAHKLGVDEDKKVAFLEAVQDATKTQGTQISKGQTVTIDGDSMGITPSEARAAQDKGVEVNKPAAQR